MEQKICQSCAMPLTSEKSLIFRNRLASLADDKYRVFSMSGIPCDRPFLGVRIPEIRKLVSEIPSTDFTELLEATPTAIEEVIARGFLIARLPY